MPFFLRELEEVAASQADSVLFTSAASREGGFAEMKRQSCGVLYRVQGDEGDVRATRNEQNRRLRGVRCWFPGFRRAPISWRLHVCHIMGMSWMDDIMSAVVTSRARSGTGGGAGCPFDVAAGGAVRPGGSGGTGCAIGGGAGARSHRTHVRVLLSWTSGVTSEYSSFCSVSFCEQSESPVGSSSRAPFHTAERRKAPED